MNYEIAFYDEALIDLRDAILWYNSELEGLGQDLETQFYNALPIIAKGPNHYQIRYLNCRVFWLKRFPYGIHYFVDNNLIVITALVHSGRNPDTWHERLK